MLNGLDVIVQSATGTTSIASCRGFVGLPVAHAARFCVIEDGAPDAASTAVRLGAAFDAAILNLGPSVSQHTPPCNGQGHFLGCMVENEPTASNLLVWVTGAAPPSPAANLDLLANWIQRGWDVVCVLPDTADYDSVVPADVRDRHAIAWRQDPAEVVFDVLARGHLLPEENRTFVSYRRADGRAVAEELFHLLAEARFEVFLDRFSLDPGVQFLEQIEQEIADKALLVVVESPTIHQSTWVDQEIAFALTRRIGIAAVSLPGGFDLPAIDDSWRVRLGSPDLQPPDEVRVLRTIRELHARAIVHRREVLVASVRAALDVAGVPRVGVHAAPEGLDIQHDRGYALRLAVRPPLAEDLEAADRRALRMSGVGVCVGSMPVSARRKQTLGWLVQKTQVNCWDEADLTGLASAIRTGAI